MKIKVLQSHIDNGKKKDCRLCPIALAIQEILKDIYTVSVSMSKIHIFCKFDLQNEFIKPSFDIVTFIWQFDNLEQGDKRIEPFEFDLYIPLRLLK